MAGKPRILVPKHLQPVPDPKQKDTYADRVKPVAPKRPPTLAPELHQAWDDMVQTLDDAGLIATCDAPTIELCLRHFILAVRASNELLAADSLAVWDEDHQRWAKHPADMTFRGQSESFLKYATQLGMTFATRARTPARDDKRGDENPFEATG